MRKLVILVAQRRRHTIAVQAAVRCGFTNEDNRKYIATTVKESYILTAI